MACDYVFGYFLCSILLFILCFLYILVIFILGVFMGLWWCDLWFSVCLLYISAMGNVLSVCVLFWFVLIFQVYLYCAVLLFVWHMHCFDIAGCVFPSEWDLLSVSVQWLCALPGAVKHADGLLQRNGRNELDTLMFRIAKKASVFIGLQVWFVL